MNTCLHCDLRAFAEHLGYRYAFCGVCRETLIAASNGVFVTKDKFMRYETELSKTDADREINRLLKGKHHDPIE